MAKTVTLSDGRTLEIDLNKVTIREWRDLFRDSPDEPDKDFEIIGRIVGLSATEAGALGFMDWVTVRDAVTKVVQNPLATTP